MMTTTTSSGITNKQCSVGRWKRTLSHEFRNSSPSFHALFMGVVRIVYYFFHSLAHFDANTGLVGCLFTLAWTKIPESNRCAYVYERIKCESCNNYLEMYTSWKILYIFRNLMILNCLQFLLNGLYNTHHAFEHLKWISNSLPIRNISSRWF